MGKRILILVLLTVLCLDLLSQDSLRPDRNNLDFRVFYTKKGSAWTWHYPTCCTLSDSLVLVNGKIPLKFKPLEFRGLFTMRERLKYKRSQQFPFRFSISQAIYLPLSSADEEVEVSITTKCTNAREVWLHVGGFDRNEQLVYLDSVEVTSPDAWQTRGLRFMRGATKYLRIGFRGEEIPGTEHSRKGVWVDRVGITIGGKDLYDYPLLCDTCADTGVRLRPSHIRPLASGGKSALSSLPVFRDPGKRIIGLGECMHGTETIDSMEYVVLRSLIEHNDCKLVMLEMGVDDCLDWDLYTRGISPDSVIHEIEDGLRGGYRSSVTATVSFFKWLRAYNSTCRRKVRLCGVDDPASPKRAFFNYFRRLEADRMDSSFLRLLKSCYVLDYPGMLHSYTTDASLRNKLQEEEYGYVLSALERASEESRMRYDTVNLYDYTLKYEYSRERSMAARTEWLIEHHLRRGEKAVLLMHSGHVNKLDNYYCFYSYLPEKSVGSYLSDRYGDAYYALTFQVGRGTYRQSVGPFGSLRTNPLSSPPYNSFEYSALESGRDCFFYPVSEIPDGMSFCRLFPVGNKKDCEFVPMSLQRRYDGILFIRDCHAATNGISNSMDTGLDLYYKWSDKRHEFIKELEKKLEKK